MNSPHPSQKTNVIHFPLMDGPLLAPRDEARTALVLHMAADLIETDTFRDRRAAFEALVLRGHRSFLVSVMVDDAMQWAMQCVVETEMSEQP